MAKAPTTGFIRSGNAPAKMKPTPGPTPTRAPVQGPGLGHHGDKAVFNNQGKFVQITNTKPVSTPKTTSGGGGGGGSKGGGGSSQPQQDTGGGGGGWSPPDFSQQEADYMAEIDRTFNNVMNILNEQSGYLESSRSAAEKQAQADLEANKAQLGTQKTQALRGLGEQRTQGQMKREDALAQARRLYSDLQRGALSRFGAMGSGGQAASEILGGEQMRQQGQTQQQYAQFERDIQNAENKVNEDYDAGLLQLNQSFQQARSKIAQDFNSAIMQINNMRAATEQEKGAARLNALQNIRSQVNQLNMQQMTFNQQLEAMRQQQLMNIQAYKQTGSAALGTGQSALGTITSPTTDTMSRIRELQPGQTTQPQYIGQIGKSVIGRDKNGYYQYSDGTWGPGGFLNQ